MSERVVARWFEAKDYLKALAEKEASGGILRRFVHPTLGPMYEVLYLPPPKPIDQNLETIEDFIKALGGEERALQFINNVPNPYIMAQRRRVMMGRWQEIVKIRLEALRFWRPFGL